jgi:hypothetical protein
MHKHEAAYDLWSIMHGWSVNNAHFNTALRVRVRTRTTITSPGATRAFRQGAVDV